MRALLGQLPPNYAWGVWFAGCDAAVGLAVGSTLFSLHLGETVGAGVVGALLLAVAAYGANRVMLFMRLRKGSS